MTRSEFRLHRVVNYLKEHDAWNSVGEMSRSLNMTKDMLAQIAREYDHIIETNADDKYKSRTILGYRLRE